MNLEMVFGLAVPMLMRAVGRLAQKSLASPQLALLIMLQA